MAERRVIPFHPPLLAAFPILAIFSANTGLFPLSNAVRPLGIALAIGTAIWLICSVVTRSFSRGALMAFPILASAWGSTKIIQLFEGPDFLNWVALALAAGFGFWWSRRSVRANAVLNRFALALVLISGIATASQFRSAPAVKDKLKTVSSTSLRQPDIYLILLDGYGREDQLRRVMGFDNSSMIEFLRGQGFDVLDTARTNYVQTALSAASMLNLDYIQNLMPDASPTDKNRQPAVELVKSPTITKVLKASGYTSVAIGTGFPAFQFKGYDLVLGDDLGVTYFESVLMEYLPAKVLVRSDKSQYDQRREILRDAFARLHRHAPRTAQPRFFFVHIMAPHPPFVFDGESEAPHPKAPFGYFDGSDYLQLVGTPESYRKGYAGQIEWVNARLEEWLAFLLARSGEKPIVLLQGDHGSKLRLDQNDMSKTDLEEALCPLAAYYLPDDLRAKLSPKSTPVNVLRMVVESVTGHPYPALPDRTYYSPFQYPYEFHEVTR